MVRLCAMVKRTMLTIRRPPYPDFQGDCEQSEWTIVDCCLLLLISDLRTKSPEIMRSTFDTATPAHFYPDEKPDPSGGAGIFLPVR